MNYNNKPVETIKSPSENRRPALANLGVEQAVTQTPPLRGLGGIILLFLCSIFTLHAQTVTAPSGSGTEGDPYQIAALDNLYWLSQTSSAWGSYFIQTADINASATTGWNSGSGFSPIGNSTTNFTGHYNGAGHTITGLYISRSSTDYVGLFGDTDNAKIDSLGVVNCDISGDDCVGGLVGRQYKSTVNNSYSTGGVSGDTSVGGLVGRHQYTTINNSYSTGSVSGDDCVGGLVGENFWGCTVSSSYSVGSVSGVTNVGGLVGEDNGDCTVSNCYWNTETSGQISSTGGIGLTTAQMKQQSSFSNWDFDANWEITNGKTFPRLRDVYDYPMLLPKPTAIAQKGALYTDTPAVPMDYEIQLTLKDYPTGMTVQNGSIITWTPESAGTYTFTVQVEDTEGKITECTYTIIVIAFPGAGAGTKENPFEIATLEDLQFLSENSDGLWNGNFYFIQTAGIDASATTGWNEGSGFSPIGNSTTNFTGHYNGAGHTITGLYISRSSTDYVGLFGYTNNAGIDSLGIINCNVTGNAYAGGLVGNCYYSEVNNCYATGTVTGAGSVSGAGSKAGGLAGCSSSSEISNSYASVTVTGVGDYVGGLVGHNYEATESNCYATGSVTGEGNYTGGLVGRSTDSEVNYCYSTGLVTGSGSSVGGLVGDNYPYLGTSTVNNCYWDTQTSGQSTGDGGTGLTTAQMKQQNNFSGWDFDNTWEITNGKTFPRLRNVYDYPVILPIATVAQRGTLYTDTIQIVSMDYEIQSVTLADNPEGMLLQNGSVITWTAPDNIGTCTFTVRAEDTEGATVEYSYTIKVIISGEGTNGNPYEIATLEDLKFLSENSAYWGSYFIQTADIDASATTEWNGGSGFSPIGNSTTNFTGHYNGAGHIISNLYINRPSTDNIGLFGYTNGAEIDSLGIADCNITGKSYTGGLTGRDNNSAITNSYVAGTVSGTDQVGGLIGYTENTTITNSYATGTVSGNNYVGGLTGQNRVSSTITNCYSAANVSGHSVTGGLVGYNVASSAISNSYATGSVLGSGSKIGGLVGHNNSSTVSNCYYNSETSGQSNGIGDDNNSQFVTGLTTAQMKQQNSFSGWDFDNTWEITNGKTFPRLRNVYDYPVILSKATITIQKGVLYSTIPAVQMDYEIQLTLTDYPAGMVVQDDSLIIWTPGNTGTYTFTVRVEDTEGATTECSYTIKVIYFPTAGAGTKENPFEIATLEDLQFLSENSDDFWNGNFYFIQTAGIDASATTGWNGGSGFSPIGNSTTNFTGHYNGAGHTITGLYINSPSTDVGLFGYTNGAVIDSLGIANCDITGDSGNKNVGGLVGYTLSSEVNNCYVTGYVTGAGISTGGLTGCNKSSEMNNCYTAVIVTGANEYVGGLVGHNSNATENNCYATGNVTGSDGYTGGLVGRSTDSEVNNCYATGQVTGSGSSVGGLVGNNYNFSGASTINSSYYNSETSGQSNGIGGDNNSQSVTGLTTAEMKQQNNFSGWDFDNTWEITNGKTFPRLRNVYDYPMLLPKPTAIAQKGALYTDTPAVPMDYEIQLTLKDYPTGMTVQNGSIITWTPESAGTYTFTVQVEDTEGAKTAECTYTIIVIAFPGAGAGTKENPFEIATLEDLQFLSENSDGFWNGNFYFIQTAGIDASATTGWNEGSGFSPIGNSTTNFTGHYNGAGHTITGLYINRPSTNNIGLFGYTNGAVIDSLGIANCDITGDSGNKNVGGLVGYTLSSEVNNCYVTGYVTGAGISTGGLTGCNKSSEMNNCYTAVIVTGANEYVGGLVGHNSNATENNCYATGNVTGSDGYTGGLVGRSTDSEVNNCYATGQVTGSGSSVGGLVGNNYNFSGVSTINSSYYNSETSGQSNGIGGDNNSQSVTGLTTAEMKQQNSFSNWDFDNTWEITNGKTFPRLRNVYDYPVILSKAPVTIQKGALYTGTIPAVPMDYEIQLILTDSPEGMVVQDDSLIIWTPGNTGTYTFTVRVEDTEGAKTAECTYTIKVIYFPTAGAGTKENPFEIATLEDLQFLSENSDIWDKYFIQTADINASATTGWNSGSGFSPIGNSTTNFTGHYNGAGYIISNLYINRPSTNRIGLFGYTSGAVIDSLGIANCDITGGDYHVGGLVGYNYSSQVNNCYVTGSISGSGYYVGGLLGTNTASSAVGYCYSTGSVRVSHRYVGGLIGYNNFSTVNYCYSAGSITGASAGGLLGYNSGTVINCYYNSETSGQSNGIGDDNNSQFVTGLTIAQMKQQSSFSGWDFTTTWAIRKDSTYAALQGINNAPFAFSDIVEVSVGDVLLLDTVLLANDCDYETGQAALIYKIISATSDNCTINGNIYTFNNEAAIGSSETIMYHAGELLAPGDTLWGNVARAVLNITTPSGNGTENDPYQIATLNHLGWLSQTNSAWNKYFIQTADIDASETTEWDTGSGFSPIGNQTTNFTGQYNGKGHTITGLYINRPSTDYTGLFGHTSNGTVIDSLGIANCDITGNSRVGGLVGLSYTSCTISNCYVTGSVTGSVNYVGGLAGYNYEATVSNSHAICSVTGSSYVGGLVGHNYPSSTISYSYATGSVTGSGEKTGGLAGCNKSSEINNCYATGSVAGAHDYVGGLVGHNYEATESNCYATGSVTGEGSYTGGLVGRSTDSRVNYCYSTGLVTGSGSSVGGLVGDNYPYLGTSTVSSCYWDTQTSGQSSSDGGTGLTTAQMKQQAQLVGFDFTTTWAIREDNTYAAMQGLNNAPIAFADSIVVYGGVLQLDTMLTNDYDYETGQSSLVYQIISAASNNGSINGNVFIFSSSALIGSTDTIVYRAGEILAPGDTLWGNTAQAVLYYRPYEITTLEDLKLLSENSVYWDKCFIQTTDIDASATTGWNSGSGFSPIGNSTTNFTGHYNGAGHTITGLYINSPSTDVGLFGYTNGAVIDSLGIANCDITGDSGNKNVGGLVGYTLSSEVNNCYVTGYVTGAGISTGGLTGCNKSSEMNNCYTAVIVTGANEYVGGLVGHNSNATENNCYATGNVTGSDGYTGGLVGRSTDSEVNNCYATGQVTGSGSSVGGLVGNNYNFSGVSTINSSYYNSETSGQSNGIGGDNNSQSVTGLTTAEMKQQNSFSNWDFDNTWEITNGKTFPRLRNVYDYPVILSKAPVTIQKGALYTGTIPAVPMDYEIQLILTDSPEGMAVQDGSLITWTPGNTGTYTYTVQIKDTEGATTGCTYTIVVTIAGSGTSENPYEIATLEDLKFLSENSAYWGSYFIQAADIDASATTGWNFGSGFSPIGNDTTNFTGHYNGAGYIISNLYINRPSTNRIGLFGYTSGAVIDSLGIANCDITGGDYHVGGLAGYNYSSQVNNCYVTGNVSGKTYVGGLLGTNTASSAVGNCYSTCNVTGSNHSGGLAGYNNSSAVNYCYSTGSITGSNAGGLLGYNSGTVSNCYYNSETSGQSSGIGSDNNSQSVTGLTTIQMKQQNSFSNWDFDAIWEITNGKTFPRLRNVYDYPVVLPKKPATVQTGSLYTDTISAIPMDYEIQLTLTDYPAGMAVQDGSLITWTPGNTGTYTYTVQIKDTEGATTGCTYTIVVTIAGSGTSENPYEIATLEDLKFLSENSAYWGSYFIQTANIDASATAGWNFGSGFSPIGNDTTNFTGHYNGAGYIISNLYINRPSTNRIGLFGYTSGAVIDSLGIANCDITGGDYYVGGLAGYNYSSQVNNCYVTGNVSGKTYVGGLLGTNTASSAVGNCYSTCNVTGSNHSGGLAGYNNSSAVNYCYSTGSITGSNAGGLLGYNSGTVSNCYYNSETSGQSNGIGDDNNSQFVTGLTTAQMKQQNSFSGWDFDNTWEITNGKTFPRLRNVYDYPVILSKATITIQKGVLYSTIPAVQMDYEIQLTLTDYPAGMVVQDDSLIIWTPGNTGTYTFTVRVEDTEGATTECSYTIKVIYFPTAGAGTKENPFEIATLEDLQFFSENSDVWGSYFIQTADIDASATTEWNGGSGFSPIGNSTTNFTGHYNGAGHIISNLYINRPSTDNIGLFGYTNGAEIDSLGIADCNITGKSYTGGLTGRDNNSAITNSYVAGTVSGTDQVGGLIGYTENTTITNSYATGTVSGNNYVGGLTGQNRVSSTITNCYSAANVSGHSVTGGLVGYNVASSAISNSYATGSVLGSGSKIGGLVGHNNSSTVSNCYYNSETSGQSNGIGDDNNSQFVTGLTTAQMKQQNSFSGWDFDNTWEITNGKTFPRLRNVYDYPVILSKATITIQKGVLYSTIPAVQMDYEIQLTLTDYPAGMVVQDDSLIIWTPGNTGTYTFTVRVEDTEGATTECSYTIKVIYFPTAGAGTKENPFEIATLEDLQFFSENSDVWGSYFIQTADIDASATTEWNGGSGFSPIGNSTTNFTGHYNGAGHTITGLYINSPSTDVGLFGYTNGAVIDSLGLVNCDITGDDYVGGLVGHNSSSSTVNNSYSTGNVSSSSFWGAGGLVGCNSSSTVSNSYSTVSVLGDEDVGGLVGFNNDESTVSNSYSTGNVLGSSYVGGFVGYNEASSAICNSYSTGSVSGSGTKIGGLVGDNSSTVSKCFFNSETSGQDKGIGYHSGDVTGLTTAQMKQQSSFSGWDFDNTWEITNGKTFPCLRNVYDYPVIVQKATTTIQKGTLYTAIPAVQMDYEIQLTLTDYPEGMAVQDGSLITWTPGNTGTYTYTVQIKDTEGATTGCTYTIVVTIAGSGTSENPFEIATLEDLQFLSGNSSYWNKHFIQTADIDASATSGWNDGSGFSPIGNSTTKFTGQYNGAGHIISNLYINSPSTDYVGLFGYTNGAVIDSLGVVGCDVKGHEYVGGLVAYNCEASTVSNCYVIGEVTGIYRIIGGLIGRNRYNATVSNCYAAVSVSGPERVGGLVGDSYDLSVIRNCYATGNVITSGSYNGGLIGLNSASTVNACYSTGNVTGSSSIGCLIGYNYANSTVTNCYYNSETGAISEGVGTNLGTDIVTGLTTAQMQTAGIFINTGWKFAAEDSTWALNGTDNNGYPFLRWQGKPGNIWLGTNSTAWETAANWSENRVPADTIIIAEATNAPEINSTTTVEGLTIETNASLTVKPAAGLTVSGTLTNHADATGLVLQSDATGTATLINSTAGVRATVQQYITGTGGNTPNGRGWYMSTPISDASSNIFGDFEDSGNSNGLWYYVEPSQGYVEITTNSESLDVGTGYVLRTGTNETVEFAGTLNSDEQTLAVTRTGTGHAKRGFNLVGNPYPSYLDWDALYEEFRESMRSSIWYRTSNANNDMVFDIYNASTQTGTKNNGKGTAVSGLIPPCQAVWVKVDADPYASDGTNSVNLFFTPSMQSHGESENGLKQAMVKELIRMEIVKESKSDETVIVFHPGADRTFNSYDSEKQFVTAPGLPQLYTVAGTKKTAINGLSLYDAPDEIPLGLILPEAGNFSLQVTEMSCGIAYELYDKITRLSEPIYESYNYSFTSGAGDIPDRFVLQVKSGTGVNEKAETELKVYSTGDNLIINTNTPGELLISDILGRIVYSGNVEEGKITLPLNGTNKFYLVRLQTEREIITRKFVK